MRGQWNSLVLAVAFSLMLNLALACSFVWPDLLGQTFPLVAWPVLTITWCLSFWVSWKSIDSFAETHGFTAEQDDTLFIQAQTEYLNGNFSVCFQMLTRHLTDNPRDLESRLLLATTCRRLDRLDEAFHQLATFRKIDGWQQWSNEVQRELHFIENLTDEDQIEADSGEEEASAVSIRIDDHNTGKSPESEDPEIDQPTPTPRRGIRLGQSIAGTAENLNTNFDTTDTDYAEPKNPQPRQRAA